MMCEAAPIPAELLEAVAIDPNSPSGLTWVSDGGPRRRKGNRVGHRMAKYWCTEWKGTRYWIHRIVQVKKSGKDYPNFGVDHINGNGFDNTPDNLRWADQALNSANMVHRRPKNNGLPTGIEQQRGTGGYRFYLVGSTGKRSKTYATLDEAVSARALMLTDYQATLFQSDDV